ncbi:MULTISPECIES: hypothetical protein [unclassified Microbacterium]|uniref:hypothetical protein n=1 Tax=unclassified Microbacterium TaxID=2609290 RepID=UPI00343D0454
MTEKQPLTITLYARVGDSEVLNEIGSTNAVAEVGPLEPSADAAADAGAQVTLDLAGVLREMADQIDARSSSTEAGSS